jgi:predicted XRE-type DNA-binding protein
MAASTQTRNAGRRRQAVTCGTTNVFADLGFPDAVERQAKLRLAHSLNKRLARRQHSPAATVKALGVTQPEAVALRRYKLAGFSVERLMSLLTALGHDVEIVIRRRPHSRKAARISVVEA